MALYQKVLDDRLLGIDAPHAPGRGWQFVAGFPALVDQARMLNLPLHLRAGTYLSPSIEITASNGSGHPFKMTAEPGTAIVKLDGAAPYLLKASGIADVTLENIVFDGGNAVLTDTSVTAGLIRFSGREMSNFSIRGCEIRHAARAGIACDAGAAGRIAETGIHDCATGIFCLDATVAVEKNQVSRCTDNGILIWMSAIGSNRSRVAENHIDAIGNRSGGTGQYGNGINVFRANNVKVIGNTIANCSFSAIRLNASGNCHVTGNDCQKLRETAIYVEAPGQNLNLDGGVVANNIVNGAGGGIQVVNAGLYNDGISRRISIIGNQVANLTRNFVPEESGTTAAIGIIVESSCNVFGNSVENATAGIILGTNNAATDLTASGNFIHSCAIGIGYSANRSAAGLLITGNLISNYISAKGPADADYPHSGAIVSVSFNGRDYVRDNAGSGANIDYGNAAQTLVGGLTVGMNKARL